MKKQPLIVQRAIMFAKKYQEIMRLCDFRVYIRYVPEYKHGHRGGSVAAENAIDLRYKTSHIALYKACYEDWRRFGDADLENTVAHEIAHIATQALYEIGAEPILHSQEEHRTAWESLTEKIARLAMNVKDE